MSFLENFLYPGFLSKFPNIYISYKRVFLISEFLISEFLISEFLISEFLISELLNMEMPILSARTLKKVAYIRVFLITGFHCIAMLERNFNWSHITFSFHFIVPSCTGYYPNLVCESSKCPCTAAAPYCYEDEICCGDTSLSTPALFCFSTIPPTPARKTSFGCSMY